MQILETTRMTAGWVRTVRALRIAGLGCLLVFCGCSRDTSFDAIETDANGYLCMKCGAKLYTDRKVFLESKCPKCGQDGLADVVGFKCVQDQRLTIRPKVSGPEGAAVCEQCGAHLKNAMVSPREADLKKWGATKI
jgi:DNA-directed RNA polymerase subunit RPC12/RpoP